MKIPFKWENIGPFFHARAKVFGGWIVRSGRPEECMVFIPDPDHEWEIEKP